MLLSTLALASFASPAPLTNELPGQVFVKVREGASLALDDYPRVASQRRTLPAPRRNDRVGLARVFTLQVEPGYEDQVVARLSEEPWVDWAERNRVGGGITGTITPPDDTFFFAQWGFDQPNDIDVDMPEAWNLRGTLSVDPNLLVGVIDSGFPEAPADADLAGLVWTNPGETLNGLDDDGNGFVDDLHGYDFAADETDPDGGHPHGYWVTSLMASRTNNAGGIAGLASGMTTVHARAFDDLGEFPTSGPYAGKASAAAAILYLTDLGCDLVNNSWTDNTGPTQLILDAVAYATDNGVHMVFGSANDDLPDSTPANEPSVIAVAGIDSSGIKSTFSNYGPWVEVSAGATGVAVLDPDLGAVFVDGTSFAGPYVSGIAAHVLSEDGDLSQNDLRGILMDSATDLDALNPTYAGQLGTGHVNAAKCIEMMQTVDDLGLGLAGNATPILNSWGTTLAGDPLTFSLSSAEPSTLGLFVVGFSRVDLPYLSGTLVPFPNIVKLFATSPTGEHQRRFTISSDIGAGAQLWVQMLTLDVGAPEDWAFSNAVVVTGA